MFAVVLCSVLNVNACWFDEEQGLLRRPVDSLQQEDRVYDLWWQSSWWRCLRDGFLEVDAAVFRAIETIALCAGELIEPFAYLMTCGIGFEDFELDPELDLSSDAPCMPAIRFCLPDDADH